MAQVAPMVKLAPFSTREVFITKKQVQVISEIVAMPKCTMYVRLGIAITCIFMHKTLLEIYMRFASVQCMSPKKCQ